MSKRRSRQSDDGSKRRRTCSSLPHRRLDPLALARGSTSRWVGVRSKLAILTDEEMDRDLRHMEAYANACTAYAQQHFIYSNRSHVQSGMYGKLRGAAGETNFMLPVRIDPEEEKRMSQLRKRIAASERLREVLETEYVSLRASYVYESHALEGTRTNVDSQLLFLQSLVRKRGRVVALQRVRCAMARDILSCLKRGGAAAAAAAMVGNKKEEEEDGDILQVWNDIEAQLWEAERALQTDRNKTDRVMQWDARTLPRTPNHVPIYLSQLSSVPDRGAAFGCGGIFGAKQSSMCWLQSNLPKTSEKLHREKLNVKQLQNDVDFLERELEKERAANASLQSKIADRRKKNDEMCALMAILRSETEAVLQRHNILLDTPEARAVAEDLHFHQQDRMTQQGTLMGDDDDDHNIEESENAGMDGVNREDVEEDLDHDGDDEGDDDEEEMFEV